MRLGVLLGALAVAASFGTRVMATPGGDYWNNQRVANDYWGHQWSGNLDNDKTYQQYPDNYDWPADQTYWSPLNDSDKSYLDAASQADRTEIQLGQLAGTNSQNDAVKRYADQLVRDHRNHLRHLHMIAEVVHYNLPDGITTDEQTAVTTLTPLQGDAFDAAFRSQMLADHEGAIHLTINETQTGHNWWLKSYAQQSLPTLEDHLAMADDYLPYTPPVGLPVASSMMTSPATITSTYITPTIAVSTTATPSGTISTATTTNPNGSTTTTTTTTPAQ